MYLRVQLVFVVVVVVVVVDDDGGVVFDMYDNKSSMNRRVVHVSATFQ